jgi:hypothetical protein
MSAFGAEVAMRGIARPGVMVLFLGVALSVLAACRCIPPNARDRDAARILSRARECKGRIENVFSRAQLHDVRLDPAVYDHKTRWPAGFDPQAHGARPVE